MKAARSAAAEDALRRLAATLRSAQLYAQHHPIVSRSVESLSASLDTLLRTSSPLVIGFVADEVVVDGVPVAKIDEFGLLFRRLQRGGAERIAIERGVGTDELSALVTALAAAETFDADTFAALALPHVRMGRITVDDEGKPKLGSIAAFTQLYGESVAAAEEVWESATTESAPDASVAQAMTDGLADAVGENRRAMIALTTLKEYDSYTFSHMVNVSILTMAQAHSLGVEGARLREFGIAGLMHDIGKVRTPLEILNKPDRLTPAEFEIMKRHPVEGAEILRLTPSVPTLAAIVAFEHHLRLAGTGYPDTVSRQTLNLGTMLCTIADVYDAMRSHRLYQGALPTDRILEVLRRNDGQFDPRLVRRFVQLVGIYPVGNLVRLDTGEIAVVLNLHPADPYRPEVRVLTDRAGQTLDVTYDVKLWEISDPNRHASIASPVDPADYPFDPLTLAGA